MEILYIPVEILNKMALWLAQQQNEDGAFIETAEHYYDRNFWVNTVDIVFLFQFFSKSIVGLCLSSACCTVGDRLRKSVQQLLLVSV